MKLIFGMLLLIISSSSFAAWNEMECNGHLDGKEIKIEIEDSFRETYYKNAVLSLTEAGETKSFKFRVAKRLYGPFNRLTYLAKDFHLKIDLRFDEWPQWRQWYKADFISGILGTQSIQELDCTDPYQE